MMLRNYKVKLPGKFCVVLFPFLAVDVFPGSSRMLCADHMACLKSALFLRLLSCVMTASLNPEPPYCLGPVFPWRRALNLMDLWAVPHQCLFQRKLVKWVSLLLTVVLYGEQIRVEMLFLAEL